MRWISVLFVVLVAGGGVVACSSGDDGESASETTADGVTQPPEEASLGLASVALPGSEAEVVAVMGAMPDEMLGLARVDDPAETVARYGGEMNTLVAGLAADFSGSVMSELSVFSEEPTAIIEASDLDSDADVVWLIGSFEDDSVAGTVYVASWGTPDGEWIFSVNAETPEMRQALVEAFVDAA